MYFVTLFLINVPCYHSSGYRQFNITCKAVNYDPVATIDNGDEYGEDKPANEPGNYDSGGANIRDKFVIAFMCLLRLI